MPRPKLIIFDWDGTLMDSAWKIVSAMQSAFKKCGLSVPSEDEIRAIIGLNMVEAISTISPAVPNSTLAKIDAEYRSAFRLSPIQNRLFAGSRGVLEHCKKSECELAIATGKSRRGLAEAMAACGVEQYFTYVRTADTCASKPAPEMLQEILAESGYSADDALMIGDTTFDLQMANAAGIAAVGASYGAHPREALEALKPQLVIDDIRELPRAIENQK